VAEIVDEYTDSSWDSETLTPKVVDHNNTTIGFRAAHPREVARIHELTVREIGPGVASLDVMQRVHQHDPNSLWVVLRAEAGAKGFRIVGTYGYLFLNPEGVAQLEDGVLDTRNPPTAVLARPDERPAQIYIWLMVARKLTALLAPLVIKGFPKARYGGVPLAARAGTIGGLKSVLPSAIVDGRRASSGVGDVFKIDLSRTSVGARLRDAGQRQ
jgi:hypothetical protein